MPKSQNDASKRALLDAIARLDIQADDLDLLEQQLAQGASLEQLSRLMKTNIQEIQIMNAGALEELKKLYRKL